MSFDLLGHAPQEHHDFKLIATVSPTPAGWDTGATIDFVDADGSALGCADVPVDAGNQTSCTINNPAPGTYHFKATYSGNDVLAGIGERPRGRRHHRGRGLRRGPGDRRVRRFDLPGEGRLPRHRDDPR